METGMEEAGKIGPDLETMASRVDPGEMAEVMEVEAIGRKDASIAARKATSPENALNVTLYIYLSQAEPGMGEETETEEATGMVDTEVVTGMVATGMEATGEDSGATGTVVEIEAGMTEVVTGMIVLLGTPGIAQSRQSKWKGIWTTEL